MKKIILSLLVAFMLVPSVVNASTDASGSEFSWNYEEIDTVPGVGVFANTIYLMDDGIPYQEINEEANLLATYTSDDVLTFAQDQGFYLFGGAKDNTTIVVNGDNFINVILDQTYVISGDGSLTIDSYKSAASGTGWVSYDLTEEWIVEHITTDMDVVYNEDGSVTFTSDIAINNKLEANDVIFETTESFADSYKLDVTNILDSASDELKSEVSNNNKTLVALYDISVVDENNSVVPMEDGTFTIRIKLTDEMLTYDALTAAYILDGKIVETFNTTIDGEYVVFNTTHLSEYAILGENTTTDEVIENPSTGDNIMQYAIVLCLSAIGFGYVAYTLRKEN